MDVSKLPFDLEVIRQIKQANKLKSVYPVLNDYVAFKKETKLSLPRAFELIVLLYSVNSPLLQSDRAKTDAAKYFGYDVFEGKIVDKKVADMLSGQDKVFNEMIIAYCRMQKNDTFSTYVIYKDSLYRLLAALKDGSDEEKTKDTLANIKTIRKEMEGMVDEFLNNDTSVGLKQELFEEVERESLGIRPEEIAEKLEAGEDPLPGFKPPYGKDYNFQVEGNRAKINPLLDD